jgi:hypothetical protein
MQGQFQAFYKNGETRIVNLNSEFFEKSRENREPLSEKAKNLAFSFNPEPYRIFVYMDGNLKYQKTFDANTPDHILEAKLEEEERKKKELKKAA